MNTTVQEQVVIGDEDVMVQESSIGSGDTSSDTMVNIAPEVVVPEVVSTGKEVLITQADKCQFILHTELVDVLALKADDLSILNRLENHDMSAIEDAGKSVANDMQILEVTSRIVGKAVVERYFWGGSKINAVAAITDKAGLRKWLKDHNIIRFSRDNEVIRQMRDIASMGSGILQYATLGKNRVRELRYMLKELPEYQGLDLKPENIQAALQNLQAKHPFPIVAEMSQEDIKGFRTWMDGIITKWRIDTALKGQWEAPFELCKQIGGKRGLALEKHQAEVLAAWLIPMADKVSALTSWIDNGIPKGERPQLPPDPARLVEALTKVTTWANEVAMSETLITLILKSTAVKKTLRDAAKAIQELDAKLPIAGEVR